MTVQILTGDCREILRTMPSESVHCCVTSPPYFGLRDYGVDGQMGLEASPEEFVAGMVAVFAEVHRVLRSDGTLWLNIGDSYAGSGRGGNARPENNSSTLHTPQHNEARDAGVRQRRDRHDVSAAQRKHCPTKHGPRDFPPVSHQHSIGNKWVPAPSGIKQKDMIGIPWMLAFALRAAGWYLRQDIIWAKPNPMPESVRDRCTKAHEYLFLLSKSSRYYFDVEAIKEPAVRADEYVYAGAENGLHSAESRAGSGKSTRRFSKGIGGWASGEGDHSTLDHNQDGRVSHGAKVKNNGVGFGHGYDRNKKPRVTHAESLGDNLRKRDGMGGQEWAEREFPVTRNKRSVWTVVTAPFKEAHFATFPPDLIVDCIKAGTPQGGVVLDPFFGAGTTGLVADRLQRDCIGIELNPKYAAMARKRIQDEAPLFADVQAATGSSGSTTTGTVSSSSSSTSPDTNSRSAP